MKMNDFSFEQYLLTTNFIYTRKPIAEKAVKGLLQSLKAFHQKYTVIEQIIFI